MSDKLICSGCIREAYLKDLITRNENINVCSFCEATSNCISITELSELIDDAVTIHFKMAFEDAHGDFDGQSSLELIMNIAGLDEIPSKVIKDILEEEYYDFNELAAGIAGEYGDDVYYVAKDPDVGDLEKEWRSFEKTLKTEARFFNSIGLKLLDSIFEGVEELRSNDGLAVLREIGLDSETPSIFRARVFQSPTKLESALKDIVTQLGPPPSDYALAGRMNARGISVFYGADTLEGAVSEVRPPIGAEVVVGKFIFDRKVNILDLTAIPVLKISGSYFDLVYNERLRKSKFLQTLAQQMALPVLPDDQESAYLVTQAIADFLASRSGPSIDGMIYPSVQSGKKSKNIILFHKAARVAAEEKTNMDITAHVREYSEHGWMPEYVIFKQRLYDRVHTGKFLNDKRRITFRLDQQSLKVYEINTVNFQFKEYPVLIIETVQTPPEPTDMPF